MSDPAVLNRQRAEDAFAVHAALLKAQVNDPALRDNPQWTIIRQEAFERFSLAFEGAK